MNDNEFDQIVRSVMYDAEEEVPSRVWASVSSRTAEESRPKAVLLNWKKVAAGVAAAAAIVAGVFISKPTKILTNTIQEGVSYLSDASAAEESAAEDVQVLPSDDRSRGMLAMADALASSREAAEPARDLIAEQTPEAEETQEPAIVGQSTAVQGQNVPDTGRESSREEATETITDPFAQMAYEDSHRQQRRGISFTMGGDMSTNSNAAGISRSRLSRQEDSDRSITQISKESSYSVPISFGAGISIPLSSKWSLTTGLDYSFLERTFTGVYKESEGGVVVKTVNADIRNSIHYVGIPVSFSYDILSGKKTRFYAFAGGSVEKAILNKFRIPTDTDPIFYSEKVKGVQLSAAAGFGVTFVLTDHLGFYVDPSVRYYFDCDQPVSIRTQQPLTMNLELGLRFNL